MGCPRGGPEALELETDDDDDESHQIEDSDGEEYIDDDGEKPLDPRAGHVDVELSNLPVPARLIADVLREMLANTGSKAHRRTKICLERFEKLAKDEYPLPVEEVFGDEEPATWRPTKAARELKKTEKRLVEEADELALRGLSRKHRKRLLAKSRAGNSIIEEVAKLKNNRPSVTNGEWTVESTENKEDTSNKENESNKKKRKRKDKQTDAKRQKTDEKRQKTDEATKKVKAEKKKNERKINMIVNKRDNKLKKIQNNLALADSVKTFFENRQKGEESTKVKNEPKTSKVSEKPTKAAEKTQVVLKTIKSSQTIKNHVKITEKHTVIIGKQSKIAEKQTKIDEKQSKIDEKQTKIDENQTKIADKQTNTVDLAKIVDIKKKEAKKPTLVVKKVKNFQKQTNSERKQDLQKISMSTPKKVKFVLKNNSAQLPAEYARAVRTRPGVPFDARLRPTKGNLKPSAPTARNPFAKSKK